MGSHLNFKKKVTRPDPGPSDCRPANATWAPVLFTIQFLLPKAKWHHLAQHKQRLWFTQKRGWVGNWATHSPCSLDVLIQRLSLLAVGTCSRWGYLCKLTKPHLCLCQILIPTRSEFKVDCYSIYRFNNVSILPASPIKQISFPGAQWCTMKRDTNANNQNYPQIAQPAQHY